MCFVYDVIVNNPVSLLLNVEFDSHWAPHTCGFIIFINPSAWARYDTGSIFKQSFPSPRLVASPRLKNPVCPTIYPLGQDMTQGQFLGGV